MSTDKELWDALQSKDKPAIQESLKVEPQGSIDCRPVVDEDAERAAFEEWFFKFESDNDRRPYRFEVWLERASRV